MPRLSVLLLLSCLGTLALTPLALASPPRPAPINVLYVTDYSDFWHDYHQQAEILSQKLPQFANVELTIVGRTASDAKAVLRQDNFAAGFDVIMYNACHADTDQLDLIRELRRQIREESIPVMFMHCAMHNFRKTSPNAGIIDRIKLRRLRQQWQENYPNEDFPRWWQLTGADSTSHALPQRLVLERSASVHPIVRSLPEVWATPRDELYLIHEEMGDIQVLYRSQMQRRGKQHPVAWVRGEQGTRIFATTLGHDRQTLELPEFQRLLANGLLWLVDKLDEQGLPHVGFEGLEAYVNYSGSIRCQTGQVLTVSTIAEIQAAVRQAYEARSPLRAVSIQSSNSYSPVICPEHGGTLLQLKGMNRVLEIDKKARQVRLEPGVILSDLGKMLHAEGLFLPAVPDYNGVSVAGAIGTGSHHSSLKIPASVSDWVAGMKVVDGQGELRELTGEQLRAGRVHMGVLGVVVEITLNLKENRKIQYQSYELEDDQFFAQRLLGKVNKHDYARAAWFPHSSKIVVEAMDLRSVDTPGESVHNLWEANSGILAAIGELPNQVLNVGQGVQCKAERLRSGFWQAPITAVNSSRQAPVGWAHQILGSSCEPGKCAWEQGLVNRTMELALPLGSLADWVADVKAILADRPACFPVLGIYLRFARAGDHMMAMNSGQDVVIFEIHIPTRPKGDGFEPSSEVYDEIQQMTLQKYQGRPHWGKNSRPIFLSLGTEQYPEWDSFIRVKNELDPRGLFESEFWRDVLAQNRDSQKNYLGCVYDRTCICSRDVNCGSERTCETGGFFEEAKVCVNQP